MNLFEKIVELIVTDSLGGNSTTGTLTVNVTKVPHAPVFLTPEDDIIILDEGITHDSVIYTASASCASGNTVDWVVDYVSPTGNGTIFDIDVRGSKSRFSMLFFKVNLNFIEIKQGFD